MIRTILSEPDLYEFETWQGPGPDSPADQDNAPDFEQYAVVVWDYNPPASSNGEAYQWSRELRDAWVGYIRAGGRALLIHASNNPFPGWTEFEDMVGLLWRSAEAGAALQFDENGDIIMTPQGQGQGSGHGRRRQFVVHHHDPGHPVLAGLPEAWLHASDELYHWQRGPRPETMLVLASTWDDPELGGSGRREPVFWQIPYGEGIVMTWLPGHLWRGQADTSAYRCVGLQTILRRAVEWLATGGVSQPVPEDFPTPDRVTLTGPLVPAQNP